MKRLLVVAFGLMIAFKCSSQGLIISEQSGLITYKRVYEIPGLTADQIWDKAKIWYIKSFRSSKEVIVGESKPAIINGIFIARYGGWGMGVTYPFYHSVSTEIEDGKLTLTIDQIYNDEGHTTAERYWKTKEGTIRTKGVQLKPLEEMRQNLESIGNSIQTTFAQ